MEVAATMESPMEEPGEEARDHYLLMAEKMSRASTPHSSNCGARSPAHGEAAVDFSWDDDGGLDDLGLDWPVLRQVSLSDVDRRCLHQGDEEMTEDEEETVRAKVKQMKSRGVRLLAIDNDLTLISIHTGGSWSGSAHELAEQARPIFRVLDAHPPTSAWLLTELACAQILIDEAVAHDMFVAIVTFSSQPELIQEMLAHLGLSCDVSKMIVRGGLNKVRCGQSGAELVPDPAVRARYEGTGKQEHVACAVQYFEEQYNVRIEPKEVLMIDDDVKNLEEGKKCGIQTAFFDPIDPMQMIESMDACPNAQKADNA